MNPAVSYVDAQQFINKLRAMPVEHAITQEQGEHIAWLLHGDRSLFIELDERPGQYDADYASSGWHWKLRQARNSCRRFFDILAEPDAPYGSRVESWQKRPRSIIYRPETSLAGNLVLRVGRENEYEGATHQTEHVVLEQDEARAFLASCAAELANAPHNATPPEASRAQEDAFAELAQRFPSLQITMTGPAGAPTARVECLNGHGDVEFVVLVTSGGVVTEAAVR